MRSPGFLTVFPHRLPTCPISSASTRRRTPNRSGSTRTFCNRDNLPFRCRSCRSVFRPLQTLGTAIPTRRTLVSSTIRQQLLAQLVLQLQWRPSPEPTYRCQCSDRQYPSAELVQCNDGSGGNINPEGGIL